MLVLSLTPARLQNDLSGWPNATFEDNIANCGVLETLIIYVQWIAGQ